jgi:CRP/FNR family nitrogen fixation transcriptional regulator
MTVQLAIPAALRGLPNSASWTGFAMEADTRIEEGVTLRFEQDQEIFGEGEAAGCYYKLLSGVVRTCKFLSDGRRQVDAFHVAGDLFGIEPGASRSLSAEAVGTCRIVAIRHLPFDTHRGAVAVPPQLFLQVMRNLARAQDHAVLLGRRSALEKVAAFLLSWADQSATAGGTIWLAMGRQDIGDYLGLTIETVSRTLSLLERDGIIELPSVRQIRVKDLEALTGLSD